MKIQGGRIFYSTWQKIITPFFDYIQTRQVFAFKVYSNALMGISRSRSSVKTHQVLKTWWVFCFKGYSGLAALIPEGGWCSMKPFRFAKMGFLFSVSSWKLAFTRQQKTKNPFCKQKGFRCCPSRIRTYIVRTKNWSPALRRSGTLFWDCKNTTFLILSNIFYKKTC